MALMNLMKSYLEQAGFGEGAASLARRIYGKYSGGYILAYHTITKERFREQIDFLLPDKPVPLSEIIQRDKNNYSTAGLFAITFDDGDLDTVLEISRLAIEMNLPVTFYLPTDYLNGKVMPALILENLADKMPEVVMTLNGITYDLNNATKREQFFWTIRNRVYTEKESSYYPIIDKIISFNINHHLLLEEDIFDVPKPISWELVTELSKFENISFESHGMSHQAVVSLSESELELELINSKEEISNYSHRDVNHFCYPYGSNESIGELAHKTVSKYYLSAVTMNKGRLGSHHQYLLPRIPLYQKDNKVMSNLKLLVR